MSPTYIPQGYVFTFGFNSISKYISGSYMPGASLEMITCSDINCDIPPTITTVPGASGFNSRMIWPSSSSFPLFIDSSSTFNSNLNIIQCSNSDCSADSVYGTFLSGVRAWTAELSPTSNFYNILWIQDTTQDAFFLICYNTDCSSQNNEPLKSKGTATGIAMPTIHIDGDLNPHLLLRHSFNSSYNALTYFHCSTITCSSKTTEVVHSESQTYFTSIITNPNTDSNLAWIAAHDSGNNRLLLIQCQNDACTTRQKYYPATEYYPGQSPSMLFIQGNSYPFLTYLQGSANADLYGLQVAPSDSCPNSLYAEVTPGGASYCRRCPKITVDTIGSYNPQASLSETCEFVVFDGEYCPAHFFLNMTLSPPQCKPCPSSTTSGSSYNPEPNTNTECVFTPKAKTTLWESPETYVYIGGGFVASCSVFFFVAFNQSQKKFKVTYKDLDLSVGTVPTQELTEHHIINALTLDGGGIRGICLVTILQELESQIGLPPQKLFHIISGTSTGGLLALGFHNPRRTLKECLNMYLQIGTSIFKNPPGRFFRVFKQVFGMELYDSTVFETILKEIYGHDTLLFDEDTPEYPRICAVATLANLNPPIEFLFRNYTISSMYTAPSQSDGWKLWEAARATSAAPLFFKEFSFGSGIFADGALIHNNPSRICLQEVRSMWPKSSFGVFLSLGTGIVPTVVDSGFKSHVGWIKTLAEIATNSERAHKDLLHELSDNCYFRLSPNFPTRIAMDDASSIDLLQTLSQGYLFTPTVRGLFSKILSRFESTWSKLNPRLPSTLNSLESNRARRSVRNSILFESTSEVSVDSILDQINYEKLLIETHEESLSRLMGNQASS